MIASQVPWSAFTVSQIMMSSALNFVTLYYIWDPGLKYIYIYIARPVKASFNSAPNSAHRSWHGSQILTSPVLAMCEPVTPSRSCFTPICIDSTWILSHVDIHLVSARLRYICGLFLYPKPLSSAPLRRRYLVRLAWTLVFASPPFPLPTLLIPYHPL
jgi:hypothetical protein